MRNPCLRFGKAGTLTSRSGTSDGRRTARRHLVGAGDELDPVRQLGVLVAAGTGVDVEGFAADSSVCASDETPSGTSTFEDERSTVSSVFVDVSPLLSKELSSSK